MADASVNTRRLRRKTDDGSYDVIYLETASNMVQMSSGKSLDEELSGIGAKLESIEAVIGQLDTVFRTVVGEP